jgi:transmembrane sensor
MQEKPQDPLVEEALHWLAVLKDRNASEADRQAFDRWLKHDPSHEAAWRRAQLVWMRLDRIGPAFRNRAHPPAPSPPRLVAPPSMRPQLSASLPARPGLGRRSLLYATTGVAAGVVIVAVPAAVLLTRPSLFADHATAVGERRKITLDDGSKVELAGSTSLSIDFTADLRRIVLHEGEAFFNVIADPARPFVVDAATGRTRASGAAFDIKMSPPLVAVAVTAHSVFVSANGVEPVTVNEGQRVRYGPNLTGAVRDANLDQVEAWRRDRLVFQDTPLGEVIADLERYRGGRIFLMDSSLRTLLVTGAFDTSEADAALDAIASMLPVRADRLIGSLVVLSSKS